MLTQLEKWRIDLQSKRDFFRKVNPKDLISVDVFDTLLLRRPISERRRFLSIAKRFIELEPDRVGATTPRVASRARAEAQRFAYRAFDITADSCEVRLCDICGRQLSLLGLSANLLPTLLQAELEIEKEVLFSNRHLVDTLRALRGQGNRIVAISDTPFTSDALKSLIASVVGANIFDNVYTSADLGTTKRKGDIYPVVAKLEGVDVSEIFHFGDDWTADVKMAVSAGVSAVYRPRSKIHVYRRKLDAVRFEIKERSAQSRALQKVDRAESEISFGRTVIGPILAEYCVRLWLYLSAIGPSPGATALFCARGGLNLRVFFEHFLERVGLTLDLPRQDFMVSRLIAARSALLRESHAVAPTLVREFAHTTAGRVVSAIGQFDIELGPEWDTPFHPDTFWALLNSQLESAIAIRSAILRQDELFRRHLTELTGQSTTLILCDTGLYGSTLRMLQAAFPERQWECLLLARCNYKYPTAPHFRKTVGLLVERDFYVPYDRRSVILRYWHLIEHMLEPALPSVKTFHLGPQGGVISNLEIKDWRKFLAPAGSPLLSGALEYVTGLSRSGWFSQISKDTELAWRKLKRSVTLPSSDDIRLLVGANSRSRDFGTTEAVSVLNSHQTLGITSLHRQIRSALWREGAIVETCGSVAPVILRAYELAYSSRGVMLRLSRRP